MRMDDVVRLQLGDEVFPNPGGDVATTPGSMIMVGPARPDDKTLNVLAEDNRMRELAAWFGKAKKWAPYAIGGIALLVLAPMLLRRRRAPAMGCYSRRRRRR